MEIIKKFPDYQTAISAAIHNAPGNRESQKPASAWNGNVSFDEAIRQAIHGTPDLTKKVMALTEQMQVNLMLPTEVQIPRNDIEGSVPDIGAFLRGEPEDMVVFDTTPQITSPRFVTLQIEGAVCCNVSAEQLLLMGATLAAASIMMRASGITLNVLLTTSTRAGRTGNIFSTHIPLPRPDTDLPAFIFAVASPAMLRRIFFSLAEAQTPAIRQEFDFYYGYGSATITKTNADIVFDLKSCPVYDLESAKKTARAIVEQLSHGKCQ